MKRRDFALTAALSPLLMTACGGGGSNGGVEFTGAKAEAAAGLKRAAQYMDEVVSYQGGYVWSYSPDLKQTFGEMEAYRTMGGLPHHVLDTAARHALGGPCVPGRIPRHG